MNLFRRKQKSQKPGHVGADPVGPPDASIRANGEVYWDHDESDSSTSTGQLAIRNLDELVAVAGNPIGGDFVSGEYIAGPKQGGRSKRFLPAREGEIWKLSSTVRIVYRSSGDTDATILAGPIFFDADGKVLQWWRPLPCVEGPISVEAVAPSGTAKVAAGIYGVWFKDREPPLVKVAFGSITLARRS